VIVLISTITNVTFMGPCIANVVFPSITNKMQHYTIYFYSMLYMFQSVPPPFIRSSYLYIQHWVFVIPLLLPAAVVFQLIHDSVRWQ